MTYVVDTRIDHEHNWFVVIDPEKNRVIPKAREFATREEAENWVSKNLEKISEENIRYRELVSNV